MPTFQTDALPAVAEFHRLYYEREEQTWKNTTWLSVPIRKCPLDMWIYQEILVETRPDLIVETGTYKGGSALFLAHVCDLLDHGRVVTIEQTPQAVPEHPRITYLNGSSTAETIVARVRRQVADRRAMVILDSDHSFGHVLSELRSYAPLVSTGCYLIVEDTNVNAHPVRPDFGPGPMEAVKRFLAEDGRFVVDESREKLLMTFNPGGYLRRSAD
jgi:cephalosporin hydroxylase